MRASLFVVILVLAGCGFHLREQTQLPAALQELRIEVDKARQSQQVSKITGTDYFRQLRGKANDLRDMLEGKE